MTKKTESLELIEWKIARWFSRLKRAVNAMEKLERKRKRLIKAADTE